MPFEDALRLLKRGERIARATWGPVQHVELREGRFRLIEGVTERTMTWFGQDLLAEDWVVLA